MSEKWIEYKINKNQFAELIGYAAKADDKCGKWWINTTDKKTLALIVEEDSK